MQNVVVYSEVGRFGGWPANHGIWGWGDELVVGFQSCMFRVIDDGSHAIDKTKPRYNYQARSQDGGRTWSLEDGPTMQAAGRPVHDCSELADFDFSGKDVAISFSDNRSEKGTLLQYVSNDRCRTWEGPYMVRIFPDRTIEPRIDYLIRGKHSLTAFFTAFKSNGEEGNVFCAKFEQGAWRFVSWFDEERDGFMIMPSSIPMNTNGYYSTVRWQREGKWGIAAYLSNDEGASWKSMSSVAEGDGLSNPPSLLRLQDGRLCVTYANRTVPYEICARLSKDDGISWSEEQILRSGGGHWDLGYTRSCQLPSGDVVTVYYFCRDKNKERTIEATIWRP